MKLIWTKSKLPLSVLIRWFLNSDCSHFALVFKSQDGGLMFESNLVGTHPKFLKTALKHMEVVHVINLNITTEQENKVWDMIVDQFDGHAYNYKAFFYFCFRAFLYKFFRRPLPIKNPWSGSESYLCEQIAYSLETLTTEKIDLDLSMISPEDLYHYLRSWVKNASL